MEKVLTAVLIGAGCRGEIYTDYMHEFPEHFKIVAVADPEDSRKSHVKKLHNIPDDMCFTDYNELLSKGKLADMAIICTQDSMHFDPAMKAIDQGYDLLLEKPISPTAEECIMVNSAAKKKGVKVIICTVLRYTPLFSTIKRMLDEGCIGQVISINHEENVGNVHQSHSFVRGNWGNEARSSNMLLQKSCHDMDLISWLIGAKCTQVQSFGSLSYFKSDNAPEGAPERCIDGCPVGDTCPYNSVKLYLDDKDNYWFRSTSTHKQDPTDKDVEHTLRTTQYGKCVFKCDNDVVDHQTVNMLFDNGATATFTMNAFNKGGRQIHLMGTKGEIHAALADEAFIELYDFETKTKKIVPITGADGLSKGHGGGDEGIVDSLYRYLALKDTTTAIPEIGESCRNHILTFAAEESRHKGKIVDVEQFIDGLGINR